MLDARYSIVRAQCWEGEAYFVKREANCGGAGRGHAGFLGEGKLLTKLAWLVRVNDKSAEEAWKIYDSRQVKLRC